MSKIYVRLAGGLGNQLFQLAAASLLSRRVKQDIVPLIGGLSRYDTARQSDSLELLTATPRLLTSEASSAITRLLAETLRTGRWAPRVGINDHTFWKNVDSPWQRTPHVLDGYFQHGWTLEAFNEAVAGFVVSAPSEQSRNVVSHDECVVHVRGGDFLQLPRFQVADTPYYLKALRLAANAGWSRIAVLTDDPVYANHLTSQLSEHLPELSFRILPTSKSALRDFDILRQARARVIGNSTFAWWASALGAQGVPTWSTMKIAKDEPRDFFLPWEIPVQFDAP